MGAGRRCAEECPAEESPVTDGELQEAGHICPRDLSCLLALLGDQIRRSLLLAFVQVAVVIGRCCGFIHLFLLFLLLFLWTVLRQVIALLLLFQLLIVLLEYLFDFKTCLDDGFVIAKSLLLSILDDENLLALAKELELVGHKDDDLVLKR